MREDGYFSNPKKENVRILMSDTNVSWKPKPKTCLLLFNQLRKQNKTERVQNASFQTVYFLWCKEISQNSILPVHAKKHHPKSFGVTNNKNIFRAKQMQKKKEKNACSLDCGCREMARFSGLFVLQKILKCSNRWRTQPFRHLCKKMLELDFVKTKKIMDWSLPESSIPKHTYWILQLWGLWFKMG